MSLDLWLSSPVCHACDRFDNSQSLNYTYNCSPMWHEIYPDDKGMIMVDGMTGEESLPKLRHAMNEFEKNPDKFISMNPPNGWGSFESFKGYIYSLIREAKEHPTWVWESCR